MPAALAAAGIAWLVTAAIKDRRNRETITPYGGDVGSTRFEETHGPSWRERASMGAHEAAARAREAAVSARERTGELGHQVSERAGDIAHRARESASDLGHRITDTAHHAREKAADIGHRVSDAASDLACAVKEKQAIAAEKLRSGASHARESAEHTFYEHPLTTGAAAIALGIAAGLAIPSTRREREMMGRRRDELLHGAREYGEELMDRGKHVAKAAVAAGQDAAREAGEEVKEAVKDEARRQHLTPGEIREEAKQKVKST
jgi:gas vesicle protein